MSALVVSNILLWVLLGALAVAVLALTRQIGVLHERVCAGWCVDVSGGIKSGETAPAFQLTTLDDNVLELDRSRRRPRRAVVLRVADVPVMQRVVAVVTRIAKEERGWLDLVSQRRQYARRA